MFHACRNLHAPLHSPLPEQMVLFVTLLQLQLCLSYGSLSSPQAMDGVLFAITLLLALDVYLRVFAYSWQHFWSVSNDVYRQTGNRCAPLPFRVSLCVVTAGGRLCSAGPRFSHLCSHCHAVLTAQHPAHTAYYSFSFPFSFLSPPTPPDLISW